MKHRYLCVGGWVTSRNDGQRHYITAGKLPQLYGVPRSECLLMSGEFYDLRVRCGWVPPEGVRVLVPLSSGEYRL